MTKKGKRMIQQIEQTEMSNQKKEVLKNMVEHIFDQKKKSDKDEAEDDEEEEFCVNCSRVTF